MELYRLEIRIIDLIDLMLNMNHCRYRNDEIIELNNQLPMEIIHHLDLNNFRLILLDDEKFTFRSIRYA